MKKERTNEQKARRGTIALAVILVMGLVCILPKGRHRKAITKDSVLEIMDGTLDTLVSNNFSNAAVLDIEPMEECCMSEPSPLETEKIKLETSMFECRYKGDKDRLAQLTKELQKINDSLQRYYADSTRMTRYHARRVRIIQNGRKGSFIQRVNLNETKSSIELRIMDDSADSLSREITELINQKK